MNGSAPFNYCSFVQELFAFCFGEGKWEVFLLYDMKDRNVTRDFGFFFERNKKRRKQWCFRPFRNRPIYCRARPYLKGNCHPPGASWWRAEAPL